MNMKYAVFAFATSLGISSLAHGLAIHCQGLDQRGKLVGADFTIDEVDRLIAMSTFKTDSSTHSVAIDITKLASPSLFVKLDKNGEITIFGFKSFNDGLETNDNISFVRGAPAYSTLELGYRGEIKANSAIDCKTINDNN